MFLKIVFSHCLKIVSYIKWICVEKPLLETYRDGEIRRIYDFGSVSNKPIKESDEEVFFIVQHYKYLIARSNPMKNKIPDIPTLSIERFRAKLMINGIKTTEKLVHTSEL